MPYEADRDVDIVPGERPVDRERKAVIGRIDIQLRLHATGVVNLKSSSPFIVSNVMTSAGLCDAVGPHAASRNAQSGT